MEHFLYFTTIKEQLSFSIRRPRNPNLSEVSKSEPPFGGSDYTCYDPFLVHNIFLTWSVGNMINFSFILIFIGSEVPAQIILWGSEPGKIRILVAWDTILEVAALARRARSLGVQSVEVISMLFFTVISWMMVAGDYAAIIWPYLGRIGMTWMPVVDSVGGAKVRTDWSFFVLIRTRISSPKSYFIIFLAGQNSSLLDTV